MNDNGRGPAAGELAVRVRGGGGYDMTMYVIGYTLGFCTLQKQSLSLSHRPTVFTDYNIDYRTVGFSYYSLDLEESKNEVQIDH